MYADQSMQQPSALLTINTAEGRLQIALGRPFAHEVSPDFSEKAEKKEESGIHASFSSQAFSVSLFDASMELLVAQEWMAQSQGAELFTPLVASTLDRLGMSPRDIGRIACVTGPGSFTGIRLALGSASGLARSIGAQQAGIPYLPLLAASVVRRVPWFFENRKRPTVLWIVTYARRNLVYAQAFSAFLHQGEKSQGKAAFKVRAVSSLFVKTPEEAASIITSGEHACVIAGSGADRNREMLQAALPGKRILPENFSTPDARTFLELASCALYQNADIVPEYVRACDAEDNLAAISVSLGLNPEEARKKLDDLTQASHNG